MNIADIIKSERPGKEPLRTKQKRQIQIKVLMLSESQGEERIPHKKPERERGTAQLEGKTSLA